MDRPIWNSPGIDEIVNLNLDDLDVEELEQRLELAAARVDDCWEHSPPPPCSCAVLETCVTFCIRPE